MNCTACTCQVGTLVRKRSKKTLLQGKMGLILLRHRNFGCYIVHSLGILASGLDCKYFFSYLLVCYIYIYIYTFMVFLYAWHGWYTCMHKTLDCGISCFSVLTTECQQLRSFNILEYFYHEMLLVLMRLPSINHSYAMIFLNK